MDIISKGKYPSNSLSNFAPHPFEMDGVKCSSMEGFLQSLKFKSVEMQEEVCKLVGYAAKKKGYGKDWQRTGNLYWKGIPINRFSKEYQILLDRAYMELYKNEKFKAALKATNNAVIKHSIGRTDPKETILTQREFCWRLTRLRDYRTLKDIKNKNLFK